MKFLPYVVNVYRGPGMDFHENPYAVKRCTINVGKERGRMPHMNPLPASLCW